MKPLPSRFYFVTAPTVRALAFLTAVTGAAAALSAQMDAPTPMGTDATSSTNRAVAPGELPRSASKIVGLSVTNTQNENVGKVEDVILDLSSGRVIAVVVSTGGFLGIGDNLSAVPPSAFRAPGNARRDGLVLDATKESLSAVPRFTKDKSPDYAEPGFADRVRAAFRSDRDETSPNVIAGTSEAERTKRAIDADNTGRNVRDRSGANVTPLDQGNGEADIATTAAIRKALIAHGGLSTNAKNVKVITIDGNVTLRGPVETPEEKRAIAKIATDLVGMSRVNDQLAVKIQ